MSLFQCKSIVLRNVAEDANAVAKILSQYEDIEPDMRHTPYTVAVPKLHVLRFVRATSYGLT